MIRRRSDDAPVGYAFRLKVLHIEMCASDLARQIQTDRRHSNELIVLRCLRGDRSADPALEGPAALKLPIADRSASTPIGNGAIGDKQVLGMGFKFLNGQVDQRVAGFGSA